MNSIVTSHIAAVFATPALLLAGLWFVRQSLRYYFTPRVTSLTSSLLLFSTNLFFMGINVVPFLPVLLFTLYAILVFLVIAWYHHPAWLTSLTAGIIMGLIILFHPAFYFALLIPLLWHRNPASGKNKMSLIRENIFQVAGFFIVTVVVAVIALWALKAKPGEIPLFGLQLPGMFTVGSKYLWTNLFSFDHGWLIYTPVLIVPAAGFYFLAENKKTLFLPLFLFCTLDITAESCWTKFDSSQCFGQTAFLQLYGLLAFPAAAFISWVLSGKKIRRLAFFTLLALFSALNVFQGWQYRNSILPSTGMNAEVYGMTFGRTHLTMNEKWRMVEITGDETGLTLIRKDMVPETLMDYDFGHPPSGSMIHFEANPVSAGRYALRLDTGMRFSPGIDIPFRELTRQPRALVRITANIYCKKPLPAGNLFLVLASSHEGNYYRYRADDIKSHNPAPGKWQTVSFDYLVPVHPDPADRMQGYLYYTGNQLVLTDHIRYEVLEQKD